MFTINIVIILVEWTNDILLQKKKTTKEINIVQDIPGHDKTL